METWKPSYSAYSAQGFATPADCPREGQIRGEITISNREQSRLVPGAVSAAASQKSGAASLQWLHSTRNLDFCLLALCSCLLAILCHQVVVIPGSSTTASSMVSSSAMSRSAQLDFLFKAGLFTGKGQPEAEEDGL